MNPLLEELDEVPCDFTAYLPLGWGVDRHTAESALANWIAEYQPQSLDPVHVLERRRRDTQESALESDAA